MQQKPPVFYSHQELNDINRDRKKRINFWGAFILLLIIVAGIVVFFTYSSKSSQLPLPSSAKTISTNTIQVPFPYRENGEVWNLIKSDQDKILRITDNENTVFDIPLLNKPTPLYATKSEKRYLEGYRYNMNTTIQLGNKVYTITEIDLNSDNTSGKAILKANP